MKEIILSEFVDTAKLKEFCDKWKITQFALFGSVLRDDFGPAAMLTCWWTSRRTDNGRKLEEFLETEDLHDIVVRQFTIIGEAARNVSDGTRETYPMFLGT